MSQKKKAKVQIIENGPYVVSGNIPLSVEVIGTDDQGISVEWVKKGDFPQQEEYALCRCGASANKPFCDGSHERIGFEGEETASRRPYLEQAEVFDGPEMALTDAESLCAYARFCDANGRTWNQVEMTDDPQMKEVFTRQTGLCSAGRLVPWDKKTGKAVEPELEVSIAVTEDPAAGCSGPLWLRGGIPVIASDGFEYEVRNRVTLCRCGASRNKPFCDGTHAAIKFRDDE